MRAKNTISATFYLLLTVCRQKIIRIGSINWNWLSSSAQSGVLLCGGVLLRLPLPLKTSKLVESERRKNHVHFRGSRAIISRVMTSQHGRERQAFCLLPVH